MEDQGVTLVEATELIESWMSVSLDRPLKDAEKALISAAWNNDRYEDTAKEFGLKPNYLKQLGQWFWKTLGLVLNEKVSKKQLRKIVLRKRTELAKTHQVARDDLEQDTSLNPSLVVLGRKPPIATHYFGYKPELAYLRQSAAETQCILLTGPAGAGKTALAAKLIESLKLSSDNRFERVVWQSIHTHSHLDSLLSEIFRCLKLEPYSLDKERSLQVRYLLEYLDQHPCLIVLDGAEDILKGTTQSDRYGENEAYRWFFDEVIQENHSSCFLLTSREPFEDLKFSEKMGNSVRCMKILGIAQSSYEFLESQELINKKDAFKKLIERYRGNPLSLKLVTSQIKDCFGGDVKAFMDCNTTYIVEPLYLALTVQFTTGYWTPLQRDVMSFLAKSTQKKDDMSFKDVFKAMQSEDNPVSMSEFMEATTILFERSLLERQADEKGEVVLSLQPVIKKFVLTDKNALIESLAA
ncbi:AAA family ATPase (plasmid) [Acaryochloris sp. 'Moss Beach']|uniref:NB-ARC domain-containing protein n=1 Tax=Acaryochloris sp. 'Moss Beach' TaxID=2740837 RepID=UPI001F18EC9A|nr:NB-ARC domain-containing protein [Acaryochloris sp. 'Moss Beach']UJB73365.1 AAA family ATPase [Acaryochloris sp. 'Moss Beach']